MRRVLKPGGTFAAVSHALPQARMDDDDEMSQGVDPTPWMSELMCTRERRYKINEFL